jgi:hypothetical protein
VLDEPIFNTEVLLDRSVFDRNRDDELGTGASRPSNIWVLAPDMGYAYDKDGKTFSYRMSTDNAQVLLKGAKKVPKGTLLFIGVNGQLYMRTGPYLESGGKFMFGPN